MDQVSFFVGLSLLFTHELDAVRQREWRIFPGLSQLDDEAGAGVFIALHVPLFLALLWALFGTGLHQGIINGFSLFCVIHVGLHLLALRHPHNTFTSTLSWMLIGGAGLCGALTLLLGFGS
jgi:hypothetical protein